MDEMRNSAIDKMTPGWVKYDGNDDDDDDVKNINYKLTNMG